MEEIGIKIIVGCLLHDIGKILYRYQDGRNHAVSGAEFLEKQAGITDRDILEQVRYHHAALLKSSGVSENSLAYIAYIADNVAAAADRRNRSETGAGFARELPLDSIFNLLNGNEGTSKYRSAFLDTDEVQYPTNQTIHYDESFYGRCIENILKALKRMEMTKEYANSLLELLEANLSFVPSSTSLNEVADISLYDHMKMTAAFGGCIFQYLLQNGMGSYKDILWKKAEQFYQEKVFLLYSMDISGIQDFIYTTSSEGALKNLRARSFYIELLMEYMADELLEREKLSRANLIYCGGGHAYILLPNTHEAETIAYKFEKDMNQFFLATFSTALYLAGGMAVCSANELKNEPDGSYQRIFRETANRISERKAARYSENDIFF